MNRSLLTPRWIALHLLFLVATTTTGFLAWWQWERAHEAGGGAQNLGYALMWPLFGAFTVFLWQWLIRLEPRGAAASADPVVPRERTSHRRRPLVPPQAPPVDAGEDPELAAYNDYLAELNKRDQQG